MGPEMVQHAIVTLTAAGAAWVVIRRVFSVVKPTGGSKCASCPVAKPPQPQASAPVRWLSSKASS